MGNHRMFSNEILKKSKFIKLPLDVQALYMHLCMNADDDGVVEALQVVRMLSCYVKKLQKLVVRGFIYPLNIDENVYYIENWTTHNKIKPSRKKDSCYIDLLTKLRPELFCEFTTNSDEFTTNSDEFTTNSDEFTTNSQRILTNSKPIYDDNDFSNGIRQNSEIFKNQKKIKTKQKSNKNENVGDENDGIYSFAEDGCPTNVGQMSDKCRTNVGQMSDKCRPKIREDKIREDKIREDKIRYSRKKDCDVCFFNDSDADKYPYLSDDVFFGTFSEFLGERKSRKKPASELAQKNLLEKLHKYPKDEAIEMLKNSIMSAWTGVFPINNKNNNVVIYENNERNISNARAGTMAKCREIHANAVSSGSAIDEYAKSLAEYRDAESASKKREGLAK